MKVLPLVGKSGAFKGATAWEAYVGHLWIRLPFWRYLKVGCKPKIGWDNGEDK